MRRMPPSTAVAAVALGLLVAAATAPPPDLAAVAARLERALIAPCCFHHTVAEHRSPESDALRADLHRRLAAGESEAEILAAYERRYGERILAAPRVAGFGLLAWGTPFVALAASGAFVWRWLRRHRPPPAPAAGGAPAPSGELEARLAAELARFES
jgi:cytochrome c-type biogenesis protein CcmH